MGISVPQLPIFDPRVVGKLWNNAGVVSISSTTGGDDPIGLILPNLPTSDPDVVGQIWNNDGIINISAGSPPGPSTYDTTILADTPVGYWPLNEISSTIAYDTTGNGHNGVYTGGFTLGQTGIGDGDYSVLLDGSTGYIDIPGSVDFQPAALSIEFWSKVANTTSGQLAMSSYNVINVDGFYVQGTTPGAQTSGVVGSSTVEAGTITADIWEYIVLTWDGTTLLLYVDGSTVGSTPASSTWVGTPDLLLGSGASNYFVSGNLAKCAFYNYALSSEQISTHYAAV
jgi:Concanavalin A-like lectin/glucanases superfamily